MAIDADHRLLLVHAHPDDETINTGATMARYAAGGAHVTLVTCTRGELGEVIPAELAHLGAGGGDALGAYRAGELAAAMAALGVKDHRFLDEVPVDGAPAPARFRDSGMAWGERGRATAAADIPPGAFVAVDPDDAAARLAVVLREVRPQVVVTYEPGGGYGHPDHVQAHRVTMHAVELAEQAGAGGDPWAVPKVYWVVFPERAARAAIAELDATGSNPFEEFAGDGPLPSMFVDDELVTTVVDSPAQRDAKIAAMRAHATQIAVDDGFFALSNGVGQPLLTREFYQLVHGRTGGSRDADGRETDLFGGLDDVRAASPLAPNYHPLPIVIGYAEGAWVTDVDGRRYLDCLAGYSALNFGHAHPTLIEAARRQLDRLTLTSRAFLHDQLEPFAAELAALAARANPALDMVLPMNTGAEAVESAIKVVRRWGHTVKGVPEGTATIVVAAGNFHGRTTTIISFSTDPEAREGFGPFTPGFRIVPYGDAEALAAAVDASTVAVLLEPVQGEAGVIIPPSGYLPAVRRICDAAGALLVLDEIQSGLGRTGTTFACEPGGVEPDGVRPDVVLLGKALGGGIVPVSAVVARSDVLGVLTAGTHGSTFGGNPLACAVGRAVIGLLREGEYQERARVLGARMHERLHDLVGEGVIAVRTIGLWAGVDVDPQVATGRQVCEWMAARGVLAKDTHGSTVRLAPPLVVSEADLDLAMDVLADALRDLAARGPRG